jgi:hypothetical protein
MEKACSEALTEFRKQYPSSTSGDLQTFVIAFKLGWESSRGDYEMELQGINDNY